MTTKEFLFEDKDFNRLSKKRGPDFTKSCKINKFNIIHNLLDISRQQIIQPNIQEDVILLFNGEIYQPKHANVDTLSIIPLYKEHGVSFVEHINGEYAIALLDEKINCLFLYSDVFATKPLFYSVEEEHLGIASYSSELVKLGFTKINQVPASTVVSIDLKTLKIKQNQHSKFSLKEFKTSYDDCIEAFTNAMLIRCNDKISVGLSSGHDSGAILQWCLDNKPKANFYYVYTKSENSDIMSRRISECQKSMLNVETIDYYNFQKIFNLVESAYLNTNMEQYKLYKNECSTLMLSTIMRKTKKDNIDIFISGQGSDEILSNYLLDATFYKNIQTTFPWNNFYEGKNKFYINQLEYIGGSFGIEVRYPFLDKLFVQEFLNLANYLKTAKYKSVISEYLKIKKLPTNNKKVGMKIKK